jgi:hypothetical protein
MKWQGWSDLRRAGLTMTLVILCAASAAAQTTLGRLSGSVLDSSGAALPGATITLTNASTNQVQTAVAGENGAYVFPQVPVGSYKVEFTLQGFKTATYNDVTVNVGQEYSLSPRLELGAITEQVEVVAGASLVSTTTPEVSATVLQKQVLDIPLANRDVTNLIKLQPGVQAMTNRASTTVNGGRPTWTTVTLDGINIQDNFIRTNSLDFLPNRPTSDNVAEFTITTSVSGADTAGGATTVRMITPSGTNRFLGSVFEFNRDARFAANTFFNNASKLPKPELSRHQYGGRLGGPLAKDKLFFFGYYEGYRQKTQPLQNLTIPANPDLLDGVFRYLATSDNTVRSVNVLQLTGLTVDPRLRSEFLSLIPSASNVNNFDVGNSTSARLLNTAGYRFNQTDKNDRDQYGIRMDFSQSDRHKFEGVYSYFKETDDRTDLDFISPQPLIYTSSDVHRFSLGWRWLRSSNFQNELRGGANLAPAHFRTDWQFPTNLYTTALSITNPISGSTFNANGTAFQAQGRYTNTYQIADTANLMWGAHQFQMGGSWQRNHVNPYNYAGQFPQVSFGFSSVAPSTLALTNAHFPGGISPAELANANALSSWLSGTISGVAQTFQVRDQNSGFVSGIPSNENYTLDNIAAYFQDNWRWKPNFTVRAGLKWEYYSPLKEDDNLGLLPILTGSFEQTMVNPATQVTFVNGEFYNKDLNNFGPTVGFNWDVTRDGRTAVRGGYSLTFVNEETVTVGRAAARGNAGLTTNAATPPVFATVSGGVPVIATPTFLSTRTLANQVGVNIAGALWGIDPDIKSPHVHQVSFGIQRELPWAMAAEARYVGTFGREIWRGIDYNQVTMSPDFLADFNRARSNGFLAQQQTGTFDPRFNAAVTGSVPLTVLPSFGANFLTNNTVVTNLQTNQAGALADFYMTQAASSALSRGTFYPNGNSGIYASQAIGNGGFSDYHSMQFELRRQFRNGLFGQVNYTWADTKTDSAGTAQNRFEAFLDNFRPELSTGRSIFHVTHVVNANAIYELPFGNGKRWLNGNAIANALAGGWQLASIVAWQSGSPISIRSGRGTFNRAGRSACADAIGCNTAFSTLSVDEIKKLLGVYKVENKIYWIDPKVIGSDGRAVAADNAANSGFAGQVFFNPTAGEVGNLPVLTFDGPSQFRVDLALSKRISFTKKHRIEVKGEAFNLTNTPSFFIGDMDINSVTFGRLTSVNVASRVVQLSVRFDF